VLTQAVAAPAESWSGKTVAAQPGMAQAALQGQGGWGFSGALLSGAEPGPTAEQITAGTILPLAGGSKMAVKTGSSVLRATA
jgi:hypothetical protein